MFEREVDTSALLAFVLSDEHFVSVLGAEGIALYEARSQKQLGAQNDPTFSRTQLASQQDLIQRLIPEDRARLNARLLDLRAGKISRLTDRVRALQKETSTAGQATELDSHSPFQVFDITIDDARSYPGIHGLVLRAKDVTQDAEHQAIRSGAADGHVFRDGLARRLDSIEVPALEANISPVLAEMAGWNAATVAQLSLTFRGTEHLWHWNQDGALTQDRRIAGPAQTQAQGSLSRPNVSVVRSVVGSVPDSEQNWLGDALVLACSTAQFGEGISVRITLGWPQAFEREINRSILELPKYIRLIASPLIRLTTEWANQAQGRRFETMVSQLSDVLVIWTPDGRISYASPSIFSLSGITPEEFGSISSTFPKIPEEILHEILSLKPAESSGVRQVEMLHLDRTRRVAEIVTVNLLDDPLVEGYLTTGRDVTARVIEQEQRLRKDQLSTAVANISRRFVDGSSKTFDVNLHLALEDLGSYAGTDRVLLWQPDDHDVFVVTHEKSRHGARNLGHLIEPLPLHRLNGLLPELLTGEVQVAVRGGSHDLFVHQIEAPGPIQLGAALVSAMFNEGKLIGLLMMSSIIGENGSIHLLDELVSPETRSAVRVVSELLSHHISREAAARSLEYHATHDALTGLVNRRQLLVQCETLMQRAQRQSSGLAVLFLDLDDFKAVNDTLGHEVGDQLLIKVAEILRGLAKEGDVVSRLGGDEFVIVVESSDAVEAATGWGARLKSALDIAFELGNHSISVRTSIGAMVNEARAVLDFTPSELLRKADIAMYRAKADGGNRFELFTDHMESTTRRRFELQAELRLAIVQQQFKLAYQPILRLSDGLIEGCEALVRWFHPTQGVIQPDEFIELCESSGLIGDLGAWVIQKAAEDLGAWVQSGLVDNDFWVAINASPLQMTDSRIVDLIVEACRREGISGSQLCVELTESTLINRDKVVPTLNALKSCGIPTSIDDFGTGFSSLSYLRDLPIDTLKIDRSFLVHIETESRDLAMVRALVALAHELGLEVVAEGIETEGQLALLTEMGCESGQGWLFSKAVPAERFVQFVAAASKKLAW